MKKIKLLDTGQRNETIATILPPNKKELELKHELELEYRREKYRQSRIGKPDLRRVANPLTKSEINRRYRKRHPDRVYQSSRNWVLNNKEYVNEHNREWRNNLPEHKKEQYRKHKREYMKEYYSRPEVKEHMRQYGIERRRRKKLENERKTINSRRKMTPK